MPPLVTFHVCPSHVRACAAGVTRLQPRPHRIPSPLARAYFIDMRTPSSAREREGQMYPGTMAVAMNTTDGLRSGLRPSQRSQEGADHRLKALRLVVGKPVAGVLYL